MGRVYLFLPPWIPLTTFALPIGLMMWLDRRRRLPDHCKKCGYNLTGNVSGICPECGKPT